MKVQATCIEWADVTQQFSISGCNYNITYEYCLNTNGEIEITMIRISGNYTFPDPCAMYINHPLVYKKAQEVAIFNTISHFQNENLIPICNLNNEKIVLNFYVIMCQRKVFKVGSTSMENCENSEQVLCKQKYKVCLEWSGYEWIPKIEKDGDPVVVGNLNCQFLPGLPNEIIYRDFNGNILPAPSSNCQSDCYIWNECYYYY